MSAIRVGGIDRPAYLSVINSDLRVAGFQSTFTDWSKPDITSWATPHAAERVR